MKLFLNDVFIKFVISEHYAMEYRFSSLSVMKSVAITPSAIRGNRKKSHDRSGSDESLSGGGRGC